MTDPRIQTVIDTLSSLIVSHARMLASEQYAPGQDVDRSDDLMKAEAEWVKELRAIRERFENLVTGMIG